LDLAKLKAPPLVSQPLWTGPPTTPILAVSAGGRFLAVSGNENHEVHVFAIKDLLAGNDQRLRLRGAGTLVHDAVFGRSGARVGLLLRDSARAEAGAAPRYDFIFDFSRRQLSDDLDGWKRDVPAITDWEVTPEKPREIKDHLIVRQRGKEIGTVRLKTG